MHLSRRQQGLIALMVLSIVGWAFDGLLMGRPKAAAAAQAAPPAAAAQPPRGPDVSTLLRILSDRAPDTVATQVPTRDPFVPAAPLVALLRRPPVALETAPTADNAPSVAPLARPARLLGVVLGAQPVAVLDGRPYPLRARVGDCIVEEIQRDRVVLQPLNGEPAMVLLLLPPGATQESAEDR